MGLVSKPVVVCSLDNQIVVYSLRGRHVEYVSPALSRHSGDRARVATGVPGGSAAGNDDRGSMGVVPKSPARIDDMRAMPLNSASQKSLDLLLA